jgi:hypothetical protein
MATMKTFGPAYDTALDRARFSTQAARVRIHMLGSGWLTLAEIRRSLERLFPGTHFPEASISAQLRHLRKPRFGGHILEKRRRAGSPGVWEYLLLPPQPAPVPRQTLLPLEVRR